MVLFPQSLRIGLAAVALLAGGPAASQTFALPHPRQPEVGRPPVGAPVSDYGGLSRTTVKTFDLHVETARSAPQPSGSSTTGAVDTSTTVADTSTTAIRVDPAEAARAAVEQFLDDLPVVQKRGRTP